MKKGKLVQWSSTTDLRQSCVHYVGHRIGGGLRERTACGRKIPEEAVVFSDSAAARWIAAGPRERQTRAAYHCIRCLRERRRKEAA